MKRLMLLGLESDKDKILDQVVKTQSIQLKKDIVVESFVASDTSEQQAEYQSQLLRVNDAIASVCQFVDKINYQIKDKKEHLELPKTTMAHPMLETTIEDLMSLSKIGDQVENQLATIEGAKEKIAVLTNEYNRLCSEQDKTKIFLPLTKKFGFYTDTQNTFILLGVVPKDNALALMNVLSVNENALYQQISQDGDNALFVVIALKDEQALIDSLASLGFSRVSFDNDVVPKEKMAQLQKRKKEIEKEIKSLQLKVASFRENLNQLKLYADYLQLQQRLKEAEGTFPASSYTFVLEGWCPAEKQLQVQEQLLSVSQNMLLYFYDIEEEEFAPTLLKNNGIVKHFETVTNSYSVPHYHEPDPNGVMSIFYFIIFGLMLADVGYGFLLFIVGLCAKFLIKQESGLKRLASLFGLCGLSAMVCGALYGSFFCFQVIPADKTILPSSSDYPMVTIILSLYLGILQIMAGLLCNARKQFARKQYWDAVLDAIFWELLLLGIALFALEPAMGMIVGDGTNVPTQLQNVTIPPIFGTIGIVLAVVALLGIMFTAGRHSKGILGKIIGGFGGLYGIINYFSDVVSYVRIFGLMLSGAMIGVIVNQLAVPMLSSPITAVFGVIILVVAHVFNIALSLLGIYIHDARLQYVEFFGKFYEGDGQLFQPLGSKLSYSVFTTQQNAVKN
ncbi:MAG: V-type ATP synthase subunit I [Clostridia bacterium]|nr:V-type ATP synthase subunit I [Clostridia bacterium]